MAGKEILTPHQNKILQTVQELSLRDETPYSTVKEVAQEMAKPESSIRTTVYSLLKRQYLERPLRGAYVLSKQGLEIIKN
jgi:Mn-dependent DtxR family transcriptional regulator